MITVLLYGHLAKKFGKMHKYAVKNTCEAVRALSANFKDFQKEVVSGEYKIFVDEENIGEEDLKKFAHKKIKIVPVVSGAGDGWTQVIVGVALIWASGGFATLGYGVLAAGSTGWAAVGWAAVGSIGSALVMSGVSTLMAPGVQQYAGGGNDRPNNRPSYAFDGAVNTTAQGNPVPLCYGKVLVGSQVISVGLEAVNA